MRVAAYQAPLQATHSMKVLDLIREQIEFCESRDIEILCCPEGILGGLADYADFPDDIAINVKSGQLQKLLEPLASATVATILGFTEIDSSGHFYNSAVFFYKGMVAGIYRKLYPAIRRSVYRAGNQVPVFRVGDCVFGVLICRDSNYAEPARIMSAQGAAVLFVPTNNGLPEGKAGPELVLEATSVDINRAIENSVYVVRADVTGHAGTMVSHGSTEIVGPDGKVLGSAQQFEQSLIVADIALSPATATRVTGFPKNHDNLADAGHIISSCGSSKARRSPPR